MTTNFQPPLDQTSGYDALSELALDLRWSWNHATDDLWKELDPDLWETTQNPWLVLRSVSRDRITTLLNEGPFAKKLQAILDEKRRAEQAPTWFQQSHPNAPLKTIAYFSMEFMLSEALPIYSGGLGNVAGDQLKTASNLGVPVIGVGLLYAQGYFRQEINHDGYQEALYPFNDPGQLPVRPLRSANGEWLRLHIDLPGRRLWLRTWEVIVGRAKLYLLDTNDPSNLPADRCITSELYGGGPELRLKQEMVLGIGGWRLLRAIGLNPEVCHLNEGHAAFAAVERARFFREENKAAFAPALAVTRAGNIFTTHTAVEAGFDRFAPELMEKYFTAYAEDELGIPLDELMALGRCNGGDKSEPFNMAYLAVRASGAISAVSALHEKVSKKIFQPLFPRWPENEVPVGHVTNGIHVPTWDSPFADKLWTAVAGKGRWHGDLSAIEAGIRKISDAEIWRFRCESRKALVEEIRTQHLRQCARQEGLKNDDAMARPMFDVDALTLGFARRFVAYKRPTLLLRDPERLVKLLTNADRPVQLLMAGKAPPRDTGGQALIKQWIDFAKRPEIRSRIMFLRDYDMLQAQRMVQGVDVWINTPLRPWEASGTSGMKVLANGGLNLSELDGWWAEAYSPKVGWAIGDGKEHGGDPGLDAAEAEELYEILEQEVIPEFYDREQHGLPTCWVIRVRESMASLTPRFSTNRAVREYTENFYLPAAASYSKRAEAGECTGLDLLQWHDDLARNWSHIHFGPLEIKTTNGESLLSVEVFLGELASDLIHVELYANAENKDAPFRKIMTKQGYRVGADGGCFYTAKVDAERPASDYTPRIIPFNALAGAPLEEADILWQH